MTTQNMKATYFPSAELQQGEHGAALPKEQRFNAPSYDHLHVKVDTKGTVVLDTPFGVVTVCIMPHFMDDSGGNGGCIDIQYHGTEFKHQMIAFQNGRDKRIEGDLYSFDLRKGE